jgi:hypothetical protein
MSNIISKVCSIPRDFHFYQNKSITQLFNESGYLEQPNAVTKESLIDHLIANPDLINDWENYSSDKRYSPAWYFLKNNSEWIVGYSGTPSQEQKQTFTSGSDACAEFILRELKQFAEHARHS